MCAVGGQQAGKSMPSEDVLAPAVLWPRVLSPSSQQLLVDLGSALALARGGERWPDPRANWGCTASHGVAFPHVRLVGLSGPAAAFARLRAPLDFEAADGRPCDLVYLLASPLSEAEHLKALARTARFFRHETVRAALRNAQTEDELRSVFQASPRANAA